MFKILGTTIKYTLIIPKKNNKIDPKIPLFLVNKFIVVNNLKAIPLISILPNKHIGKEATVFYL
jgi:hypothetical protein